MGQPENIVLKLHADLVWAKYGDYGSFQIVDGCNASSFVAAVRAELKKTTFAKKLQDWDADSFSVVTTGGVILNPEDVIGNVVTGE